MVIRNPCIATPADMQADTLTSFEKNKTKKGAKVTLQDKGKGGALVNEVAGHDKICIL